MKSFRPILFSLSFGLMTLTSAAQTNAPVPVPDVVPNTGETAVANPDADLSPATRAVIKLANSKAEKPAMLDYINNSTQPFQLTADDVIYLRDLGIESDVVTAMLQHDVNNPNLAANNAAPAPAAPVPEAVTNAPTAAAPLTETPVTPDANSFYDALSPYGSWVNVPDQGLAWQPNIATTQPAWQPYSDGGQWVWTDNGWYWASDYTWGWAPFHYGRWWNSSSWGWCWFPGTTWGPSWVSWRTWGDFCGWAPLPPISFGFAFGVPSSCFTFVSFPHFFSHDFRHTRFSHANVNNFFNKTTVINNITTHNNVTINNGVSVSRVRQATGRAAHPVPVRDVNWTQRASNRSAAQIMRNGQTAAVTRAILPPANNNPATQRRTIRAQQLADNTRITPAVSQRLAAQPNRPPQNRNTAPRKPIANPTVSTTPQTGPSTLNPQRRAVSPNERQLWQNPNREQSLTMPSQSLSRGELPNRAAPSDVREPAGATKNSNVPRATTPAPQPSAPNRTQQSIMPARPPQAIAPRPEQVTPAPRTTTPTPQVTPQTTAPRAGIINEPAGSIPRSQFAPQSSPVLAPHQSFTAPSPFVNEMRGRYITSPAPSAGRSFQSAPTPMYSAPMHSGGGGAPMHSGGSAGTHGGGGGSHGSDGGFGRGR